MYILKNICYSSEQFKKANFQLKKYTFVVLKSKFFEIQKGIQKVEKYPGLNSDLMSQGYKHMCDSIKPAIIHGEFVWVADWLC